jgi:tripartite-type tricarboxylate transporter receptor subunit TctC
LNTIRRPLALALAVVALLASARATGADTSFVAGKTIRIVVGASAGGGFDLYSRAIARHLGRHLPGRPTVIVENMPGAGSLIAANHLYKIAKPDGLTFGIFSATLVLGQVLGHAGTEFDARKFAWIGMPTQDATVCAVMRASGVTSIEAWSAARTPLKLGAFGTLTTPDIVARALAAAVGLPMQVVTGYRGTAEIKLAAEAGEVAGGCWSWDSIRATWRDRLEAGEIAVLVQLAPKPLPDLPRVPLAISLARTDESRAILEAITVAVTLSRVFAAPPATPPDRVQALRVAFAETMRDPEYLLEVKRMKLATDWAPGEETARLVDRLFTLPPNVVARLKDILK